MYIQRNVTHIKGKEYRATLLCSKYREGGKVKTKVEANLSHLSEELINGIQNLLKGKPVSKTGQKTEKTVSIKDIGVSRCIDYAYPFLLNSIMKDSHIDEVLSRTLPSCNVGLVKAMILGKIITGGSKLSIFNWLNRETDIANLSGVDTTSLKVKDLYRVLGSIPYYQQTIDSKWFRYHHTSSRMYLYDITSTYFEGTQNVLSAFGYNRDKKSGKKQICIGLICDETGFPLKATVFDGNTADTTTVREQILSLKNELGIKELVFVGDRGMQIIYHLENDEDLKETDINFITGLTRSEIEDLLKRQVIQLSLFSKDLAEVTEGNKRYVLSVNPELEASGKLYHQHKKDHTDMLLKLIETSWKNRKFQNMENELNLQKGKSKNKKLKTSFSFKDIDNYKKRVYKVLDTCKMTSYYSIDTIDNDTFKINFNREAFEHTESLFGKYIVCTNVNDKTLNTEMVRAQYKNLQHVEHVFRDLKSDNICIRPVYHRNEAQTRGHVQICIFAYAIIHEMEKKIYPFLKTFNETNNSQLSFNDIIAEIKNVKLCELKIGKNEKLFAIPDLNPIQKKIFKLFNFNPDDMIT
ncbi:MAG: IS1634 family transposase [Dysgonamonadaceae bacterium]|jgi:transposase|nr:IS1634 family transposase [Dysgonamonadaceae bacterium]